MSRSRRKARRRGQLQIDSEQVIPGFRREYVYGEWKMTMGIDVIRYDVDVEYPRAAHTISCSPIGFAGERTGTVRIDMIASGKDLDRLIDMLEAVTGQSPPGYEQRAQWPRAPVMPEPKNELMLTDPPDDEMPGEVVE